MPAHSDPHLEPTARAAKVVLEISRTPARLAEVFDDLSHWERIWRPSAGAWNCAEIAGHLLDAEIVFSYRVRAALAKSTEIVTPYDQDAWVDSQGYSDVPVEETLAAFNALRRNLVLLVTRLTNEELGRHNNHSERGQQTIFETLARMQTHDTRHLVQLGHVSELARHARPLG